MHISLFSYVYGIHTLLLTKLHPPGQATAYGIRGDYINWFRSYLTGSLQYVQYNDENSAECTFQCGVPQGSIFGPLFYYIFVNDVFNISNVLFNVLYADGTCIYLRGSDITALFDLLNVELNPFYEILNE